MNGQWVGRFSGTNFGLMVIDLDDLHTHYQGYAYAYDDNLLLPHTFALLHIPTDAHEFELNVQLRPVDRQTLRLATWEEIRAHFPVDTIFPESAVVKLRHGSECLEVSWTTNIGTSGAAKLYQHSTKPSEYEPLAGIKTWEDFKSFVNSLDYRRFIFRGQQRQWRLRTSFHRTGRSDLFRYQSLDIPTLHRHLGNKTSHVFDLRIDDHHGAFYNLLQHHGYPTPLLDWTFSPYIAAFFAYRGVRNTKADTFDDSEKVRIFIFDHREWIASFNQVLRVTPCAPHFSLLEFHAMDNDRLTPQQSISSISNIDDVETYIRSKELHGKQFLRVVDLPARERKQVMRELSVMGVTAGALFPGLDGACEEIKERLF